MAVARSDVAGASIGLAHTAIATAIVSFVVVVELTNRILQGYYTPLLASKTIAGRGSGGLVTSLPQPADSDGHGKPGTSKVRKLWAGPSSPAASVLSWPGKALGSLTADACSTAAPLVGYMMVWAICGVTALVAAIALYIMPTVSSNRERLRIVPGPTRRLPSSPKKCSDTLLKANTTASPHTAKALQQLKLCQNSCLGGAEEIWNDTFMNNYNGAPPPPPLSPPSHFPGRGVPGLAPQPGNGRALFIVLDSAAVVLVLTLIAPFEWVIPALIKGSNEGDSLTTPPAIQSASSAPSRETATEPENVAQNRS